MADDIQDPGAQGEPCKLLKLLVRSSRVVYRSLLHCSRSVRGVGLPDFQQVRKERGDAIVESLFAASLLAEHSNLQIPIGRPHTATSLAGGHKIGRAHV